MCYWCRGATRLGHRLYWRRGSCWTRLGLVNTVVEAELAPKWRQLTTVEVRIAPSEGSSASSTRSGDEIVAHDVSFALAITVPGNVSPTATPVIYYLRHVSFNTSYIATE